MDPGSSKAINDNLVEVLKDQLQILNLIFAGLENEEVKKDGGLYSQATIKSAKELLEKFHTKSEKCAFICDKLLLKQEILSKGQAVLIEEILSKRQAVLIEGRDSGIGFSGIYTQETGEDGSVMEPQNLPKENEEFYSAEEPTDSSGDEDSK